MLAAMLDVYMEDWYQVFFFQSLGTRLLKMQSMNGMDTAAKRTAHEKKTELPVNYAFPVTYYNPCRQHKTPVLGSLKTKRKSYKTKVE